jgi:hypothetical protein
MQREIDPTRPVVYLGLLLFVSGFWIIVTNILIELLD